MARSRPMPSHPLCPTRPAPSTFVRSFGLGFAALAALWLGPIAPVGAVDLARLQHSAVQTRPRAEAALRDLLPLLRRSSAGDVLVQLQAVTVGAGDPAARLTRWREVMAKARAEGSL